MKTYIVQPYYSFDEADLQSCFDSMIAHLDSIGDDADIIVLPEYSDVPADCRGKVEFHAAVAMGAEEIEFDLWATRDGELVTAHDPDLERVSNGLGNVWDHTLAELKQLDFGVNFGEKYKNLRLPTFEEILQKLAGRAIMNIHVKIWDVAASDSYIEKIAALIEKYDCVRHVYFMSTNTERLIEMRKRLPHAGYCQGAGNGHEDMIKKAIEHKLDKVQFVYWYPYDKSMIDECHAHGIRCNFCQADTPEEAKKALDMGVDCVLTNDFNFVKSGLE